MTCIAGVAWNGDVVIGGDSAGVAGWDLTVRRDPKVFISGPFIMGFTTSFRMGQLLMYRLTAPDHPKGMKAHEYMATLFVDAVRETLKAGGYAKKENETEQGGTFLVGYRGRLFSVQDDYQVGQSRFGVDACGCGSQAALGSLLTTSRVNFNPQFQDPKRRVELALEAAECLSAGVRRPFEVVRMWWKEEEDEEA